MADEAANHSYVGRTARAEYTLDDLAALHGGTAHFMLEVSERATRCHQAAEARNKLVARHQLGELTKTLRLTAMVRPDLAEAFERFINEDLAKVRAVVDAEDWEHFADVWDQLTSAVNENHAEFDHGYLVWQVPTRVTSDLDLR